MKSLTYIEIDVDHCANTFGSAPCAAVVQAGLDATQHAQWTMDFAPPTAAVTSSVDTFSIQRAQFNTVASDHSSQDRVQWCLHYNGVDLANIIRDLFVNYAGIDSSYINLANWRAETSSYLQRRSSQSRLASTHTCRRTHRTSCAGDLVG